MKNSEKLIDLVKTRSKAKTSADLARILNVKPTTVSSWKHGRSKPDTETIAKMCELAEEPLNVWLPTIQAERETSDSARNAWLKVAATAAAFVLVTDPFGRLYVYMPAHSDNGQAIHYANLIAVLAAIMAGLVAERRINAWSDFGKRNTGHSRGPRSSRRMGAGSNSRNCGKSSERNRRTTRTWSTRGKDGG